MAVISPDLANQIDGSVQKNILAHLPELPVNIIPISWFPNFVFKEPPAIRRYCLIDFMEPHADNGEYNKFWSWVLHNPPVLTFRREVLKRDISPVVKPIEWPCYLPQPERQKREVFNSRPVEVLSVWGYSNLNRPKLHGEIFSEGMAKHGINVIDRWIENNDDPNWFFAVHNWMSVYSPHWKRKPMVEVIIWMRDSKITVSLPGNGQKTFRDAECVGTLMAIQRSDTAYSYPWNESNSIQLDPGSEFNCLLAASRRPDLYELYCACDENMRKYESKRYVNDYILPALQSVL